MMSNPNGELTTLPINSSKIDEAMIEMIFGKLPDDISRQIFLEALETTGQLSKVSQRSKKRRQRITSKTSSPTRTSTNLPVASSKCGTSAGTPVGSELNPKQTKG